MLRWRVIDADAQVGAAPIRTSVAVIEVALVELDLMPVLWFDTVRSQLNGATLDLRAAPPSGNQERFMHMIPATDVAVGRMVPGACLAEVYQGIEFSQTGVFLGGPRFVTADGGTTQARQQVFSTRITGFRAEENGAYPREGSWDSRIRLQARRRSQTMVQLSIEALIKRDATQESAVLFRAAASIESNGILVLAKRASPVRMAFRDPRLVQLHRERVVLLFVLPRV